MLFKQVELILLDLQDLTDTYYYISSPGQNGNNILHFATLSANIETVRFCIGQGMNPNW